MSTINSILFQKSFKNRIIGSICVSIRLLMVQSNKASLALHRSQLEVIVLSNRSQVKFGYGLAQFKLKMTH